MTTTALVALLALAGVGSALCVWAWRTGGPGEDIRLEPPRPAARHSLAIRGQEETQRLRPAAPDWSSGLPRREDLPWNQGWSAGGPDSPWGRR
jgi:hypothetical protein